MHTQQNHCSTQVSHWSDGKRTLCLSVSTEESAALTPSLLSETLPRSHSRSGETGNSGVEDIGLPWHKSPRLLSPVCAGGRQRRDEALSTSVFGNAGMFSWGDRGDRPGASRGDPPPPPPPPPALFFLSPSLFLSLSSYLGETTKGFCTLEQSEEASEVSGVWYAGGQRISLSVPDNDVLQCNTLHISNNEPQLHVHWADISYSVPLVFTQARQQKESDGCTIISNQRLLFLLSWTEGADQVLATVCNKVLDLSQ